MLRFFLSNVMMSRLVPNIASHADIDFSKINESPSLLNEGCREIKTLTIRSPGRTSGIELSPMPPYLICCPCSIPPGISIVIIFLRPPGTPTSAFILLPLSTSSKLISTLILRVLFLRRAPLAPNPKFPNRSLRSSVPKWNSNGLP